MEKTKRASNSDEVDLNMLSTAASARYPSKSTSLNTNIQILSFVASVESHKEQLKQLLAKTLDDASLKKNLNILL